MEPGASAERYEVCERLGAGGMGEVFRAHDRKLNRFVALKFLPANASPAARERFEREAQAVAALSHPHICTLYETAEVNGRACLILELLEGETLQARLARGPLAGDALLEAALEIAEALDAAHKRGILHRDLKPSNIWLLPGGHIKILDFGLARLSGEALSEAATIAGTALLTSPGMAVGTAPYMSPEQARGEALDGRSDLFSFGAVLYEMATGKSAFARPSSAETVSAILKEDPPLVAQLPPELSRIVLRCLEKDPDLRFQSAADLRSELKRLKRGSTSGVSAVAPVATPRKQISGRWIALVAAIVIVAGLAYWRFGRAAAPQPAPALSFRQLTFSGDVADAAISPDGRFLAEVHIDPQGTSLHLLSIANGSEVQIVPSGNGCCESPTIAPDDSVVYFVANHVLESVPVLGGAIRTIAPGICSGAGVAPDGSQIAYITSTSLTSRLVLARPDGSQARVLSQSPPGGAYDALCWTDEFNPDAPAWSPDGRTIAVEQGTSKGNGLPSLASISVANGKTTLLARNFFRGIGNLAWLPGGHALVFTGGSSGPAHPQLWRVAWPGGELLQLTDDLQGYDRVTASSSGALALLHSSPQASVWVQARTGGAFAQLPGGGANMEGHDGLAWTPDGRLIATRTFGGASSQLWLQNADGSQARALALTGISAPAIAPAVAPNGAVFFNTAEPASSNFRVWRTNLDGAQPTPVSPPTGMCCQLAFIHAGATLAFMYEDDQARQSVWQAPVAGGAAKPLWPHHIGLGGNAASPDGTLLLETSAYGQMLLHVDSSGRVASATPIALDAKTMLRPYAFTPDGRAITFIHRQGSVDNVWVFPLSGAAPYPLTHFTSLTIYAYGFAKDGRLAVSRGSANTDVVLASGLGPKN